MARHDKYRIRRNLYLHQPDHNTAILGIAPEEFQIKNVFDFIHPEDAPMCMECMQKIMIEKKLLS
jgi:predicted protein tyrosine phosphatase